VKPSSSQNRRAFRFYGLLFFPADRSRDFFPPLSSSRCASSLLRLLTIQTPPRVAVIFNEDVIKLLQEGFRLRRVLRLQFRFPSLSSAEALGLLCCALPLFPAEPTLKTSPAILCPSLSLTSGNREFTYSPSLSMVFSHRYDAFPVPLEGPLQ